MATDKQKRQAAIQRQIKRLDNQLSELKKTSDQLSRLRLAVFLVGMVTAVIVLLQFGVWPWLFVSGAVVVAFAVTVKLHRNVDESMQRFQIWRGIKQTHLARMNLTWQALPPVANVEVPADHPFALDLDIVGDRSLLQLVDTAISVEGSKRLAAWLLETDPVLAATLDRQATVAELVQMPIFRDKLTLNATLATEASGEKWPGRRVLTWLEAHTNGRSLRPVLWLLAGLAVVNISLLLLYLSAGWPPLFLISWLLYGAIFALRFGGANHPIFEDAYFLEKSLRRLGMIFHFLENARLGDNVRVQAVCAPFLDESERPSAYLGRVTRLLTLASLRQNPFLWLLLNGLVPWDVFVADQLNVCKQALKSRLPVWLDAWFELEALNSLATLAYLNPDAIFPTVDLAAKRPFTAQALGHPLIPDETRICNDFQIDELGAVDIITGSNMAGKSSFLRTLGVNLCLAYAGGPVMAQTFESRLFRLYTSIRVADSVTDGFSYFYAEVRRLRGLLAALNDEDERPLFFLIDEIFRGTNNRERLIGSQSYIKALVGKPGIGLIATHDLELVKLADNRPLVRNFHFRDSVENGRMMFDYLLYPGPCPTTNALKIMELAGLPVATGN